MTKSGFIDCSAGALAVERLKQLQNCGDPEIAHSEADKVLCELLRKLSHSNVADEFEKVTKWYA
jgi:hypothetical protein